MGHERKRPGAIHRLVGVGVIRRNLEGINDPYDARAQ